MSGFRLAGLLRLRATQERLAAGDLARANGQVRQAGRLRDDAGATLAAHQLTSGGEMGWAGAVLARAALRAHLVEAEAEAALAQEQAAAAQQQWQEARARTRALERLAERHAETESRRRLKEDQQLLDDIGGRRRPGGGLDRTDAEGDR